MQSESVSLYFRAGSSDKVYQIWLEPEPDRPSLLYWRVRFAYGRRGTTLKQDFKLRGVPFSYARQTYDKFLLEKISKGYQKGPEYTKDAVPPVTTEEAMRVGDTYEVSPYRQFRPFSRTETVVGTLPKCGYCGKPVRVFLPDGSRISDTRYCSNRCKAMDAELQASREPIVRKPAPPARCALCGRNLDEQIRNPTYGDQTFCSLACLNLGRRRSVSPASTQPAVTTSVRPPLFKPKPKPVPRPAFTPPVPEDPYVTKPKRAITFDDE